MEDQTGHNNKDEQTQFEVSVGIVKTRHSNGSISPRAACAAREANSDIDGGNKKQLNAAYLS